MSNESTFTEKQYNELKAQIEGRYVESMKALNTLWGRYGENYMTLSSDLRAKARFLIVEAEKLEREANQIDHGNGTPVESIINFIQSKKVGESFTTHDIRVACRNLYSVADIDTRVYPIMKDLVAKGHLDKNITGKPFIYTVKVALEGSNGRRESIRDTEGPHQ
jgi:hypothetical protein